MDSPTPDGVFVPAAQPILYGVSFLCASKFFMTVVVGAAHRLDHRPYCFEVIVEFSGAVHREFIELLLVCYNSRVCA